MKSLELEASEENLKHIRSFVEQYLIKFKINPKTISEIKLAVGESIANVVKYGYKNLIQKIKFLLY